MFVRRTGYVFVLAGSPRGARTSSTSSLRDTLPRGVSLSCRLFQSAQFRHWAHVGTALREYFCIVDLPSDPEKVFTTRPKSHFLRGFSSVRHYQPPNRYITVSFTSLWQCRQIFSEPSFPKMVSRTLEHTSRIFDSSCLELLQRNSQWQVRTRTS